MQAVEHTMQRAGGSSQGVVGEVERVVVLGGETQHAQCIGGVAGEECVDANDIPQRLGHLCVAQQHVATVEVTRAPLRHPMVRLTLRHLVLVVRKRQVLPARVQVQRRAKHLACPAVPPQASPSPVGRTR